MIHVKILQNAKVVAASSEETVSDACAFFRTVAGYCDSTDLILELLWDYGHATVEYGGYVGKFEGSPE
jgi:hypothetical protein